MNGAWYATVEQVSNSLEIYNTAYPKRIIAQKLAASTLSVEGQLHRRFYPEYRTIKIDWPNYSYAPSWDIDLWDNEAISLVSVTSGGVSIPLSDCILRRADDKLEPPYDTLQIDLSSSSALSAGNTFQQSLQIELLTGWNDTDTSIPSAFLGGAINASATTLVLYPADGVFDVGIGSIVLLDDERIILTDRRMSHSTITTAGALTANQSSSSLPVTDASLFAVDEIILVESERMRIRDIAGNTLIVTRAVDGSTLAAHASGLGIYAQRTFTVRRGALGTTAATHSSAIAAYAHDVHPLVNELCIAETVTALAQNSGAYARVIGSGASAREAKAEGLADVRDRAYSAVGRKARLGAI
jgi:hypothetical protein